MKLGTVGGGAVRISCNRTLSHSTFQRCRLSGSTSQSPCCTKSLPQHSTAPFKAVTPSPQHAICYLYCTKHTSSTMQAHGGVEGQLHTLMSTLDRCKRHLHVPGFLAPWETALNTHWKRGWACPKLIWAFWGREISVTSTTNVKHCTIEMQYTVKYDSVGHTVQYDSVGHSVQYDSVGHTVQYDYVGHSVQYDSVGHTVQYDYVGHTARVRKIRLIRESRFSRETWKFNNAKAKSLQSVTNPLPSTSNSPSRRSNLILSCQFFLIFQGDVSQDGYRKCCKRFYPHYKTTTGFSTSVHK